ncbi:MAG: Gfo/Idh/MocA family oxidoreductase [Clostridia bacterium]|nr:Gfo/Idh/MocA family oxidoreductase [Clostridia bacterium]
MKVAVCGVWHVHAGGYAKTAKENAEVVGVWDQNPERKAKFAEKHEIPAFDSFEDLLASDAEGVIVCSSTDTHADLMVRIADAGKHIFTEKVLALSDEDCLRIEEAVKRNNVKFVISLVWKYGPGPITLKRIVDAGEIGTINYMRFRNCHSGSSNNWLPKHFYDAKECGGGAMIDLGAHGMYLIDWFCGQPTGYKSCFTNACINPDALALNTDRVEDNAVTVMSYDNGCIAVNETGFVSYGFPSILEIGGEKGTLLWDGGDTITKKINTPDKDTVVVELSHEDSKPSPLKQFLSGNILPGCGIEEAKRLTHMMVEAYKNQ